MRQHDAIFGCGEGEHRFVAHASETKCLDTRSVDIGQPPEKPPSECRC
jgi:hypothetical protein